MTVSTKRPWKRDPNSPYEEFGLQNGILIDGPEDGAAIATVCIDDGTYGTPDPSRAEAEANADIIISAVNAHDALIEVLKAVKLRIAFIGMPQEPTWKDGDRDVPDWRKEIELIETAQALVVNGGS